MPNEKELYNPITDAQEAGYRGYHGMFAGRHHLWGNVACIDRYPSLCVRQNGKRRNNLWAGAGGSGDERHPQLLTDKTFDYPD